MTQAKPAVSQKTSVSFTERMAGHWQKFQSPIRRILPLETSVFLTAEKSIERENLEFTLCIFIDDVEAFSNDPNLMARAEGQIKTDSFLEVNVEKAKFNLFVKPSASTGLNTAKEMHYRLYFYDADKQPLTLFGFKEVEKEDGLEAWIETTTLYTYIWSGHSDFAANEEKEILGLGVLHISVADFIKQLGTFNSNGASLIEKMDALKEFMKLFAGNLWQAYAPFIFDTVKARWAEHIYPLQTTIGVVEKQQEQITFSTDDGLALTLSRFTAKKTKNVVLLLHGLTTSTDMFIMPEHTNLVNYLHSQNFSDVWSLDWRGSGRFHYNLTPNLYTIDDVARYDIPKAIEVMRKILGEDVSIHVVCHCVGSISFMSSLAAGHIKGIKSVISNSVSLTPKVHWQSLIKLLLGPAVFEHIFRYPYVSPAMPYFPAFGFGKWIYFMERMLRKECKEPACHMISFMWGWGFPAAFEHKNIHEVTHRRLKDLFGGVGFHYYRHIRKMVLAKAAVPYNHKMKNQDLPKSYLENLQHIKLPPTLLLSGDKNNIFPQSNKETYTRIKSMSSSLAVEYLEIPGYGHQDVFMGKAAHLDVFPYIVEFLKKHSD